LWYSTIIEYNEIEDMHELAITQSILSLTLEQAKKVNASKITRINLTIGELTGIVEDCVRFYFELLSKDTIAAEATLTFDKPPTTLRCRQCATTFSPENLTWVCPNCGEPKIEIISGRECLVSSIEVD
jgi:hydrogenase nickel incorporation protein HypA/HybF